MRLVAKMRLALLSLALAFCVSSCWNPAEGDPASNGPTVKVLKKALPADEQKREDFLWRTFAKEEKKFPSYTTDNWRSNFTVFAHALVQKAQDQKLDSASLQSVLDLLLSEAGDRIAYLPIGAYQTTLAGKPVWLVTVKWEYPTQEMGSLRLGHICAFGFDQKTMSRVAFITCN